MEILLSATAAATLASLLGGKRADPVRAKKVVKAIRLLESDVHHPGLRSHRYEPLDVLGEKIWQSYIENDTPGAWRMWWFYGPNAGQIFIIDFGAHPD